MKILVVDDDPDILNLCAKALRQQGHDVTTCDGGAAALNAALSGFFDLALCDLNLPDVHGLEIVRAIKLMAPALPVIVMSALDAREWTVKSHEAGADHFLAKPLRLDVLRHEVSMALQASATLEVVLQDDDIEHRAKLANALRYAGCRVVVVDAPMQMMDRDPPQLVIVDAAAPGAEAVVRWAGAQSIPCFVLVTKGLPFDDRLMRMGASLIVQKPVEAEALLIQAKFLAAQSAPKPPPAK